MPVKSKIKGWECSNCGITKTGKGALKAIRNHILVIHVK